MGGEDVAIVAGTGAATAGAALSMSIFSLRTLLICASVAAAATLFAFGVSVVSKYRRARAGQVALEVSQDPPSRAPAPAPRPVLVLETEPPRRVWRPVSTKPLIFECSDCDSEFGSLVELRLHRVEHPLSHDSEEVGSSVATCLRDPSIQWSSPLRVESLN